MAHAIMRTMAIRNRNREFFSSKMRPASVAKSKNPALEGAGLIASIF
jgi:hypothetical protein